MSKHQRPIKTKETRLKKKLLLILTDRNDLVLLFNKKKEFLYTDSNHEIEIDSSYGLSDFDNESDSSSSCFSLKKTAL